MAVKVLVCWSGGKNSTRAVYEYHTRGYDVTAVCYIPMFTDTIPLISNDHYKFLHDCAKLFRSWGIKVVFLKGITYFDWCSRTLVSGKNKGFRQGFPFFIKGKCGFARDGKIKTINNYFKLHVYRFKFIDIGLCVDEYDRKSLKGKERSILQELGIKDQECFYWCRDYHLLSPKYMTSKRDGCVLCPHAKAVERYKFFEDYPEAVDLVKSLQRIEIESGKNFYPLRGKHWFIEDKEFICGYGSQLSCISEAVYY